MFKVIFASIALALYVAGIACFGQTVAPAASAQTFFITGWVLLGTGCLFAIAFMVKLFDEAA